MGISINLELAKGRFLRAWQTLGGTDAESVLSKIISCYEEPHRGHHDLLHFTELLCMHDDDYPELCLTSSLAAIIALACHDMVYVPKNSNNEEKSAELAVDLMRQSGILEAPQIAVRDFIMVTKHGVPRISRDEMLVHDFDYWILGAPPERYARYAAGIDKEFRAAFGLDGYRKGRCQLFLDQVIQKEGRVFDLPHFNNQLAKQTLTNVLWEKETYLPGLS